MTDVRDSRFNLVDLAGSERQSLAQTSGARLREAGAINKSLLALANVMNGLVATNVNYSAIPGSKRQHISYRDSKLTFLLKDSLGGNAKTLIITNVSPSLSAYAEIISSLRFAQRAKLVKNTAIVNKDILGNVGALQAEICRLKDALLGKQSTSMAIGSDGPNSRDFSSIVKLGAELKSLKLRLEMTEDLLSKKDQQLQSERMIIKFRESEISALKKGGSSPESDIVSRLEAEVLEYQRMQKMNPEISRLIYENSQLTARIQSLEAFSLGLDQYLAREQENSAAAIEAAENVLRRQSTAKEYPMQIDDHASEQNDKIENLQIQNQMLRDEIDSIRASNGSSEDFEELQTELGIKEMEIQRLEALLSSFTDNKVVSIKRLASSSEDLPEESLCPKFGKDESSTLAMEAISTLTASLEKAEKKASDAIAEKEKLLASCALLEDQLSALRISNASLEDENCKLKVALSSAHQSISTIEARVSAAETSRLASLDRCSMLEEKLFNSEARLGTCCVKISTLEESVESISGHLACAKSELRLSEDENVELKTKLQLSIEQINHISSHSKRLEEALGEKDVAMKQLESTLLACTEKLKAREAAISDHQLRLSECSVQIEEANRSICLFKEDISALSERNAALHQELRGANLRLDTEVKRSFELSGLLESAKKSIDHKKEELSDLGKICEKSSKDLAIVKASLEDVEFKFQNAVSQLNEVCKEKDQYTKDIGALSLKISELSAKNDSLSSERDLFKSRALVLEEEKTASMEAHQVASGLLDTANAKIDHFSVALENANNVLLMGSF
ncbi:hypothetical protein DI09_85p50 [Mitosporidium daphniae]|uniref:Kinesin-like protein n=1 Tax=Mitosporidium daphniae TaxID=1485682 RepID=A0A098VMW0_9MICR|nr:uncharacterized protein DI09_85p50 [Mitosporidium daphniae]KGG50154.1 hypothetical protein DI09_85p50 [Mitosporidium daphniae]|eukprot:XP_013236593.1 uncharacterized protein DI09_85p50 [Mitosporidium daphniae]